ncbi:cation/H(+) antiporter 15-like isoform X2 [Tasmannia lanceolata]|uniref:cation/H(+) antiporter 15-like isoform X2 n=1 Tax=Tasmannia lanceolata TaxID=3420 RepID=UPI0040645C06
MGDTLFGPKGLNSTMVCHPVAMVNSYGVFTGSNPFSFSLPVLLMQITVMNTLIRVVAFFLKPFGQPMVVSEIIIYTVGVILGVMVIGLATDFIGGSVIVGPLILGLVIPTGPPLGAALVEKTETFSRSFLLPLLFVNAGANIHVFEVDDWSTRTVMHSIVFVSAIIKLVVTVISSLYFEINLHEAILHGLILNFRGIIELVVATHLFDEKAISRDVYSAILLSSLVITAVVTPLVTNLTKRSRPYRAYKRRTIQHTKRNTELRILTCINGQEHVPTMINLLQASHATLESPISVYLLHLVELVGQAHAIIIDHRKAARKRSSAPATACSDHIIAAFHHYEQSNGGSVTIHPYTSISPFRTMHDDVCLLALDNRVCLILVPFHKQSNGGMKVVDPTLPHILAKAPCSVGILVDQTGAPFMSRPSKHIGVIFLGGADDREGLSYASRMAENPDTRLTVVRFLSNGNDNGREWEIDEDLLSEFKYKSVGNGNVSYKEVSVNNVEEIVSTIRSLDEVYDLMIVGRRQGTNTILLKGPLEWSENPELGVLGDLVASSVFSDGRVPVLVVQQQFFDKQLVLRGSPRQNAVQIGNMQHNAVFNL